MARQRATLLRRDFTKGLITETSALAFPENASSDELNVDITGKGTRSRRAGFDLESGHVISTLSSTPSEFFSSYVSTGRWSAPGGEGNLEFATCQIGNKLYFFNTSVQPVAEQTLTDTRTSTSTPIDMDDFTSVGATSLATTGNPVTTASGNGYLFVAGEDIDPFYVKYDSDTEEITSKKITIKVRDTEGLDDGLDFNERPSAFSDEHIYNLCNQGWYVSGILGTNDQQITPLDYFFDTNALYPSNADVWWTSRGQFDGNDPQEWNPSTTYRDSVQFVGNTKAPKGHYILDAFRKDRATVVNVPVISYNMQPPSFPITVSLDIDDAGPSRPTTVGFFAGRVWYAGQRGALHSTIFFSQVLEGEQEIPRCYQVNDPTDEENSQILATDGGTIKIPEASKIIKLQPFGEWLLVLATNGIWAIGGGTDQGFTAEAYRIKKVGSVNCINPFTVIDARGTPLFWSDGGIYIISASQVDGSPQLENITQNTIQTFYEDEIPPLSRLYATGAYDFVNHRVYWLYRSQVPSTNETYFEYDGILVLDLKYGSFLPWSVYAGTFYGGPHIMGVIPLPSVGSFLDSEDVTDGGVTVTDSSVTVTVKTLSLSASDSAVKFLIKKNPLQYDAPNLLSETNFDFEEGSLANWTSTNGPVATNAATVLGGPAKPSSWGTWYVFFGNPVAQGTTAQLSRDIDLSTADSAILDAIDADEMTLVLSWDHYLLDSSTTDDYRVTVTYKNSGGTTLDTLTTGTLPTSPTGFELGNELSGAIPATTRTLSLLFECDQNDAGPGADYALDNVYFYLEANNTTSAEVSTDLEVTFGDFWRTTYVDWGTLFTSGQSYSSYLETGHEYGETPTTFKTTPYIYVFMERDDNASLFLQGKWDFSRLSDSSEFGTPQRQAYRALQDAREVVVTRNKIRGRGRAVKLRFEAETTKPFELLGWATELEQGAKS